MRLISTITLPTETVRRIELLQGDLTNPDPNHPFDLLIVSAFPNDYTPTPSSLIGALYRRGLSIKQLSTTKDIDLRKYFSCWLSSDVSAANLGFRRILCFEPLVRGSPPEVIGDIFRALMPMLSEHVNISTVAMPIVAAGDQGWSVNQIIIPLLDAAVHWMSIGLPINILKIVAYYDTEASQAQKTFDNSRFGQRQTTLPSPRTDAKDDFDVFLSYAHEDASHVTIFESHLTKKYPKVRVFLDRKSISIGSAWQPKIFESLDRCKKVVAMLSPAYLESKVCKEEFNIAWARSRESDLEILFPIYLYSTSLPTYMTYRNYFDCREGSDEKLTSACDELLQSLSNA
jgi:hypothetical protein